MNGLDVMENALAQVKMRKKGNSRFILEPIICAQLIEQVKFCNERLDFS